MIIGIDRQRNVMMVEKCDEGENSERTGRPTLIDRDLRPHATDRMGG